MKKLVKNIKSLTYLKSVRWLQFLLFNMVCITLPALAGNQQPTPTYLQPLLALSQDASWRSPALLVGETANEAQFAFNRSLTIVVDGKKKIDSVADPIALEALSKIVQIEIAVPLSNRRYVFTSMQSLLDFMLAADMVRVQSMVEDEYDKIHPRNINQQKNSAKTSLSSDAADVTAQNMISHLNETIRETEVSSSLIDALPVGRDLESTYATKPSAASAKYRTAAGWETDESVWIMNYPYERGCGSSSVVGLPCTVSPDSLNVACRGAYYYRDAHWNPMCWHGVPDGLGGWDDSDVVTSHGGEEEHVHAHYALVNYASEQEESRQVCEIYGWFFGSFCIDYWMDGPRAIVMGRFADLVLAKVPTGHEANPIGSPRVLIKSPQFWTFCSVMPNCQRMFGLPEPYTVGYSMLPWQGFSLIPDARNTYFGPTTEIRYIEVTSYRERTTEPGLAELTRPETAPLAGNGLAALMEASTGCDLAVLPSRYYDEEARRIIDRTQVCVVPRQLDGSPLLYVQNRSTGIRQSVFTFDSECLNPPPTEPDPVAWGAGCLRRQSERGHAVCSLIYLDPDVFDLSQVLDPSRLGNPFSRCSSLYRLPRGL